MDGPMGAQIVKIFILSLNTQDGALARETLSTKYKT